MDESLEELVQSLIEIPKDQRTEILKLIKWNINKELKDCKRQIMATLVESANNNLTIYEAVVKIDNLFNNETTEKKTN